MRDYRRQAKESLKVYLQRGEKALQLIQAGMIDEANIVLRWRNAAFHNYRAAEALLEQANADATTSYLMDMWQEIAEQNAKLEPMLANHLEQARQQLQATQTKRKAIAHFRSGQTATHMLREEV